jgi:hypothetical protein
MILKNTSFWATYPVAVLLLLSAGCGTPYQLQEAASTVVASHSPAPVATLTPGLAQTPRPSRTPRPTHTHPATPYPTLEPDDMHALVLEMLESNGGCELPCWWSIVPGETSWEEMGEYFTTQGIGGWENGHLDLGYLDPEDNSRIRLLEVKMEQQDGLVHSIRVSRDYFDQPVGDDFALIWQRYELSRILSQHGVPSQVYLSLQVGSPCIGSGIVPTYDMWVEYDHMGMAILYPGMLIPDLDDWLLCPVFGQTSKVFGPTRSIEIRVQSPGLDRPILSMEPGDGAFVITGTLMELANMSVNEFYNKFSKPTTQACATLVNPERSYPAFDEVVIPTDSSKMAADEEDAFLVDMLANTDGCELPCWWGITPGVTSWQETQQMFSSYGRSIGIRQHSAGYRNEDGDYIESYIGVEHNVSLFGRHAQYPFDYVLEHTFYEQGGTVQLLGVLGHALGGDTWYTSGWPAPKYFLQDWHRYTIDQILYRFGMPSQVLLHYWPQENTLYTVAVLYESQGMLLAYMGPVQDKVENKDGDELDTLSICPTRDEIIDINIWLKSPELKDSLADLFNNWRLSHGYYTLPASHLRSPPLEEASEMSLEAFYTTYMDPNTQVCIEAYEKLANRFP